VPGDGAGADVRFDPLTGDAAVIVRERQARPNQDAGPCPFCPGGLEAPQPYDVRWFPNRWPPLPDGRAEVLLFAPEHHESLATLGAARLARALHLCADRTLAQGARPGVEYVLIFENRGAAVGATVDHPHGQLYAFGAVPPAAGRELAGGGPCPLCADPPEELIVAADDGWRAWVPDAATYPYELRVAPVEHLPDLPAATATFTGAARVLGAALGAVDRLLGAPVPSMTWVHQRPTDGGNWPRAHLHVHVAPLWRAAGMTRFVAAGELGSGVWFNPVPPAEAAAALRAQR
jgi:UDPglucose--hexose-1-phosphate uridylyltransferase